MYFFRNLMIVVVLSVGWLTTGAMAQQKMAKEAMETVGKVNFPISCGAEVQTEFERSLALLHHMMYRQAEQAFAKVAEKAPDCAMPQWGLAMTQLHPLWAPPSKAELQKGQAAVERAKALSASTPREQAYINAIGAFYKDWETVDHPTRIAAWEAAQEKVHKDNPDDIDAGAFYALSHLATAPKADKTFAHQKKAGALLEALRLKAPEHPGLYHYTIHAYDNPMLASQALEEARGYDKIAPNVAHALHMPTHIFVRLGIWPDTIDWNERSAAAALKHSVGDMTSHHYVHALDYLMYAYLQQGQDKKALEVLSRVNNVQNHQNSFAGAYGIAAAQARYSLERGQWQDAAKLPLRTHKAFAWDKFPWFESITYFARGLGAARSGDSAAAQEALKKLDAYHTAAVEAGQKYWSVPVDAQRQTVRAWLAFSEGKKDQALQMMQAAADREDSVDKHPVTPGAVLPARELLGDMLVLLEKPSEALTAYEASLSISPNRFNSLNGAGRAAEMAGNMEKAKSYYTQLVALAEKSDGDRAGVQQAKMFLAK